MELNHYDTKNSVGCSKPVIGCAIAAGVIMALVLGMLLYLMRTPTIRTVLTCRAHMTELGSALKRYHDVNNEYPENLLLLKREYLKDPSVLYCPLDKNTDKPSYVYHRPGKDAPDRFVVLECKRHRLKPDAAPSVLKLLKDGTVTVDTTLPSSPDKKSR